MCQTKSSRRQLCILQVMQDTQKGQANLNPPSVDERHSSVCQLQTILLSLHLIVDFLSKMKQNGCFILLDFAQLLPVNTLKKLGASFISLHFPYDVILDMYDLTMIPFARVVLLSITYRRNLKVYGLPMTTDFY